MKAVPIILNAHLGAALPRRSALLCIAAGALVACGGGTNVASMPGTGGTGITAMGPVAGFGSVIVNGTRFDDTNARVLIDGENLWPSNLRLGMVANIIGIKSDAAVTATSIVSAIGTANNIEVWSIAQGRVSNIVSPDKFTVAGMTMMTDVGTVLEDAMSVNDLTAQSVVKVWGQPLTADFSQWAVTRLQVLGSATDTVSTGKIVMLGAMPSLNGLVLSNSPLALKDGMLVRVSGSLISGPTISTLTVSKITPLTGAASGYAELQGVVTSVVSSSTVPAKVTRLALGAIEVDVSSASLSPVGASIVQGSRIEVEGNWNAGVLVATKVELKSAEQMQKVELEGEVKPFISLSNFTVRGQRCDASGLTKFANVNLTGKRVELHGVKNGDVVKVTELEIK
jgi:primosomal replication protein N